MRRILIVDDSPAARDALRAALDPYGFELAEAGDGAEALKLLLASRFDLAFVDLMMPLLDGRALVHAMRAWALDTRVVLVTAADDTHALLASIREGVSDYVAKPFTPEAIREVAARLLDLDPAVWTVAHPSVVVQGPDPAGAAALRTLLPARVEVEGADTLARTLERCEARPPTLVLLDAGVLEGDPETAAGLVRRHAPEAGILALDRGAAGDGVLTPEGPLDGRIALPVDPATVRGLLEPVYLRPLVFPDRGTLRAAGHRGDVRHAGAYFTALARDLAARGARVEAERDLVIDLGAVPPDEWRVAALIAEVRARLDPLGLAPAFRVAAVLAAPLRARRELHRVAVLGPADA